AGDRAGIVNDVGDGLVAIGGPVQIEHADLIESAGGGIVINGGLDDRAAGCARAGAEQIDAASKSADGVSGDRGVTGIVPRGAEELAVVGHENTHAVAI